MDKIFIEYKDYLPEGWTFERLEQLLESKAVPLTKEALAQIISEEALNMTEDDLIEYLKSKADQIDLLPKTNLGPVHPHMAYAESLEKDDELNQEFPEVKDE